MLPTALNVFLCDLENDLGDEVPKCLPDSDQPNFWIFVQGNKAAGCKGSDFVGVHIG